jgi:Mn-dependent DtxR family transcriptional regulator
MTHRLPEKPSPGQEAVLAAVRELAGAGARVSAITVGERLGISRQQAARQLSLLERKGFVADIRKVVRSGNWALTKAGERLP